MCKNPYSNLPKSAFWKTGVAQQNPYMIKDIYKKKFDITSKTRIATAGSCFAQHIFRHLKNNGYNVMDVQPPPPGLPSNLHHKFGFPMYSARYGNIYTVRQLLQLAKEVAGEWTPQNYIWEKNGKFYDAIRPAVEPEGLDSPEEVVRHRKYHLSRVKHLFESFDLFIFTLGLTEMWVPKSLELYIQLRQVRWQVSLMPNFMNLRMLNSMKYTMISICSKRLFKKNSVWQSLSMSFDDLSCTFNRHSKW